MGGEMALDRTVGLPRLRVRRPKPSVIITLADRARDAGQWELAAQLYRKVLDRDPRNPPIWVQYGHALKESGALRDPDKLAQAEIAYRKALSSDSGAADTHLHLGHVLKLQGKTDEAEASYLRAFALDPSITYPLQELSGLGWSEAHLFELRSMIGSEAPDASVLGLETTKFYEDTPSLPVNILDSPILPPTSAMTEATSLPAEFSPAAVASLDVRAAPILVMIGGIYPRPDEDSGSVDTVNFIKTFKSLGFEVFFLAQQDFLPTSGHRDRLDAMGIKWISYLDPQRVEDFIITHAETISAFFLARGVKEGGRYLETIRSLCPQAKVIFFTGDLHYVREERAARLKNDDVGLAAAMETKKRELQVTRAADATIVVSHAEAEILREEAPEARVYLAPLVADLPSRQNGFAERSGIGFIGGYGHLPNVDAVHYFLDEIWPIIHATLPQVTFYVIGSHMPAEIPARRDPGVVYAGYVPEIASWLERLRVTVAPLRYGAGAKRKVVESLAYGVPCVASPVGAEGLGLTDGTHIQVAQSIQEFAANVIELHENEQKWLRLSSAGIAFVEEKHTSTVGSEVIRKLLSDIGCATGLTAWAAQPGPLRELAGSRTLGRDVGVSDHRLSVVIPLYNHARFIGPAVDSVLAQTYPVSEIIIVDDGSTDESARIATALSERDPRMIFWSKPNGGAHAAINDGIRHATGDLVAVLNSDDVYHPERFSVLVNLLASDATLDLVASDIDFIDDDGRAIENAWYERAMAFYREAGDLALTLVNGNILMTTSNFIARRTLFDGVGYFSPLRYAHDLDFLLRMLTADRRLGLHPRPLLSYRMHRSNTIIEDHSKVKAEWAMVTAFFLHQLWDRGAEMDAHYATRVFDLLDRHGLTRPVQLCMAYFRHHPSETLERNPIFTDTGFRVVLAESVQ
jgi:GT2 family glycosyltransferase/glycosyltransferase involved in cell wall biosynthesis